MRPRIPVGAVVVGVGQDIPDQVAVSWGAHQARSERRPLVLVHALGSPPSDLVTGASVRERRQTRRITGRRALDAAVRQASAEFPGVRVETMSRPVEPARLLSQLADRARMVVLGSRGLGVLGGAILGSVGQAVSAAGRITVVVHGPLLPSPEHGIVVGTDLEQTSNHALAFAFDQAALWHAPLTVVHCVPGRAETLIPAVPQERAWLAESVAGLAEEHGVRADLAILHGAPGLALVAGSAGAALLVVGARSRHPRGSGLFGSVSPYAVAKASCAVAVVQPADSA
jgi:nucleotide-binding universal stress UspA family protein